MQARPVTQECLASVLGMQLQEARLIHDTWEQVPVRDRAGLEASACACYQVITGEYARLLGERWPAGSRVTER